MSAPIFLTTDEFLELALGELPSSVYATDHADDPDVTKRSVSSSELRAHATMLSTLSTNLETIYGDKFLSTVSADGLVRYENDYFTSAQDSTLGFALRVQNLISKLRANGGISLPAITSIVSGILGTTPFEILPYSGQSGVGGWILGQSQLGYGTYLAELDPLIGARTENGLAPLDCSLDYADEGLTSDQLLAIQRTAYTYAVNIYGTASTATLNLLDRTLTLLEPAFSTHVINNGQTYGPADISTYLSLTPEFARLRL